MNPEENNSKAAPTTVGGVTFGGGFNGSAETPAPNTPQSAPEPVDPIVESTGEEFDAVMNGTNTPASETPNEAPSAGQSVEQPTSAPVAQDLDQAPIPSNLSVPVSSPTHFDEQNTVRPIVQDPGTPLDGSKKKKGFKAPKAPVDPEKQLKRFSAMSVIFGILSVIFMVTTVVALVLFMNRESDLTTANSKLKNANTIISAIEESTGVSPITSVADLPVYKATTGYIYLSEWNIRIKIPNDLENVSYILNQNRYHPSICFNAVQKNIQYFPDFANIALNPGRMGCLTRIPVSDGSLDATTGISYGTQVFTYKDYNYFYTGPIDYSKDEANLGLEHTAQQIVKNMLTDNIEQYE